MEEQFAKIRQQTKSKLDNQKQIAITLLAVEDTLQEQNATQTPIAYFAALMSTISTLPPPSHDVQSSILYLLAIVFPYLPTAVLRSKYTEILGVLAHPLSESSETSGFALLTRSALTCLETLLKSQDSAMWSQPITKKAFQTILTLTVDPRPKVRKRAQDCARNVLALNISPLTQHPGGALMAEFTNRLFSQGAKSDLQQALHLLVLIRAVIHAWPKEQLPRLTEHLLLMLKMNKAFLTVSAFEVFESLFNGQANIDEEQIEAVLKAVLELQPNSNDEQVMPVWCEVVGKGFSSFAKVNSQKTATYITSLFVKLFPLLQSSPPRINVAISNSLSLLARNCITDDMVDVALKSQKKKGGLKEIIAVVETGLGIRYKSAWAEVFEIVRSLFDRLHRESAPLLDTMVDLLGSLRLNPEVGYKDSLDNTLGTAIANMGPENFLRILPLNIENPETNKSTGRAFLLPLLKDYTTNTELSFFVRELMPLAERLKLRAQEFEAAESAISAKIYETLTQQTYALIPGFCDLPLDLSTSFTTPVAESFSNILYREPDLRAVICQGLQLLVEKNLALSKSVVEVQRLGITREQAKKNIEYLSGFATNFLAVFFNVFSQTVPMYRGFILEVIKVYLGITPPADINSTFSKVLRLLSQALQSPETAPTMKDPTIPPPLSHTMMDLAITMVPFLDKQSSEQLYDITMTLLQNEEDPPLQKKAYKIINKLYESELGKKVLMARIDDFQQKLLDTTIATVPAAKKDRLQTLVNTISLLPSNDLHLIPSILSEAVLSTKEVNEKARNKAYELLVVMGNRMANGGVVIVSKVEGMDESMPDAVASVEEYFTMVTAGLAGQTPHMISASITSLSRLLFEFKDSLSQTLLSDLLQTIYIFMSSPNREIVKAALGFVKVATVSLDPDLLRPHLPKIITGILTWSHEHKLHFKAKVRHIIERLLRKFPYEEVIIHVPEADQKLLVNIKKRKERSRRKKNAVMDKVESEEEEDTTKSGQSHKLGRHVFASAYEDALYGSESELEDSDEEGRERMDLDRPKNGSVGKKDRRKIGPEAWIKEDGDVPLDFLDRGVVSRVTLSNPEHLLRRRKVTSHTEENNFPVTADGRLMINDSDSEAESTAANPAYEDNTEAENYYLEAQQSKDGFTRGQGNRIKFNKRQRDNDGDTDMMDMDDEVTVKKVVDKKRKGEGNKVIPIGKEYKAKRAGGDVKRKGKPDPFAYVPLTRMITKKKGKVGPKVIVTGKLRRR